MGTRSRPRILKGAVFIVWLILFCLLLQRDYFITPLDSREAVALERDARTEYQGIYFKNNKIGYVETQYVPGNDSIQIEQQAYMRLNISGDTHPIDLKLSATLNSDNTLRQFNFHFSSLFYQMKAHGIVEGNRVAFELDTGNNTIKDSLELPSPPLLSTSRRHYLLYEGIHELRLTLSGNQARVLYFFCYRKFIILYYAFLKNTQKVPDKFVRKVISYRDEFQGSISKSYLEEVAGAVV